MIANFKPLRVKEISGGVAKFNRHAICNGDKESRSYTIRIIGKWGGSVVPTCL